MSEAKSFRSWDEGEGYSIGIRKIARSAKIAGIQKESPKPTTETRRHGEKEVKVLWVRSALMRVDPR